MRFLWMFVVVFRVRCDDTTLTTTTPREYTEYPIPTWEPTRANDDENGKHIEEVQLLNLLRKDIDSRRINRPVDIWVWDLYCNFQPVKGNCKEELKRYYYDAQIDSCYEFNYTGCNGNKNNFETINECELRCKGANFMGLHENRLPTVCNLQADSGLCLTFMTCYYYDVNSRACLEFIYGGCGGNLNRFETKEECEEHCFIYKKRLSTAVSAKIMSTSMDMSPSNTSKQNTMFTILKMSSTTEKSVNMSMVRDLSKLLFV